MEKLPDYRGSLKPTSWSKPGPKPKRKKTKPAFIQPNLFGSEKPSTPKNPDV